MFRVSVFRDKRHATVRRTKNKKAYIKMSIKWFDIFYGCSDREPLKCFREPKHAPT